MLKLKKTKAMVVLSFLAGVFAVLSILLASCSNNPLANTRWQDSDGVIIIDFGQESFTWDNGRKKWSGTYSISGDAVRFTFSDGDTGVGSLIGKILTVTGNNIEPIDFQPSGKPRW